MNLKLLDFAIKSIKRRFWKNLSIFFIFTMLITLLFSIFLVSGSIKRELSLTYNSLPTIYVQKLVAGRMESVSVDRVFEIASIKGVENSYGRVWGYYYFPTAGVNFTLVGLDFELDSYKKSYHDVIKNFQDINSTNFMIVGQGVKRVLKKSFYDKYFHFVKPNGEFLKVFVAGEFSGDSELESSDTMLLPISVAREIFGMSEDEVTDIVVDVPNPKEVQTVAQKIRELFPDSRVITKEDIKASYQNIFDYKSGFFLALLISSVFGFFILVFEKASSVTKEQIKEIGILKAVGWSVEDVLKLKFLESALVAFSSFVVAIMISYFWVYIAQAPLLRDIFMGYSVLKPKFALIPVFDMGLFATVFLATVPVFISATIIPNWRASTIDAEEALR